MKKKSCRKVTTKKVAKRQVSLRLSEKEHATLKKAADRKGLSINSFIKMVLKAEKAA